MVGRQILCSIRAWVYRRRHRFITAPGHGVLLVGMVIGFDRYNLQTGLVAFGLEMILLATEFVRSYAQYQRRMLSLEAELREVRRRGPFGEAGVPRIE